MKNDRVDGIPLKEGIAAAAKVKVKRSSLKCFSIRPSTAGSKPFSSSYSFCSSIIGASPFASRQIQGNHSRSAKTLFSAEDQAAGFQLMKRPCCHLPTSMEFRFGSLNGEVQADSSIRFDEACLPGNPRPVPKQSVQHLGAIG